MTQRDAPGRFDFGAAAPAKAPGASPSRRTRWLLVVVVVALLAAAAGGGVWLWLHPAEAPAWARDLVPEWARQALPAPPPTRTRLYRWTDATGGVHVADTPPPAGTPYKVLEYRSDVNVLPIAPKQK